MDLSGISLPTDDLSTSELTPQRRGGRRSWYSPASKSMSFQIAMEANYHDDNDENEVEILELTYFFRPPRIDFGKVKVGKTVTRTLVVKNNEDYEQEVIIEKFPVKKHFSVDLVEFMVEAKDSMMLTLSWKPTETLACREMVTLKVDDAYRLQIILIGRAEEPPKPKRKHGLAAHGRHSQLSRSRTVLGEHSAGNILQRSTGNATKQSSKSLKAGNTRPAVSEASNNLNKPRRKSTRVTDDRPAEMQSPPIKASETYCVEHEEVTTKQVFTPSSLHRFVPNDSSLPDTPIRRTTFQKDDPDLPTTPANRMTFQKDDPNLPDTPINRMTFQKDDPNLPTTPANRMTFQKDDPNLPITPVNRMTFQKDDPNLPLTPVRRETFLKRQSAFEHQEQTLGDLSVAAGRLSCIADAGDEEDPRDSLESRIGDAGEGDDDNELFSPRDYLPDIVDTPGNLRRSITYTKLNVSRSPEKCPSSRVTPASSPPAPEIPEVCDNIIEANEIRNLSPANSVYFTPLTTPLDTPHGSDSESDHYEDSVMYLPGEGPMTPSTPLAVNPQGLRQNQHSPSTPLAGGRDYAIVTTSTTVHDVIYEEVEIVTEVSEIVKEFTETYVVSSDGQKKMIDVKEDVVDHIVTTYVDTDIHERVDCGEQTVEHIVTTYVDTDTHERVDCGEGTHVIEIDQKFQHDDEFGYDQIQTGGEGNHSCHEKKIVLADMSQDSLGNDPCDSDPASSKVDTNKDAKDLASLMPPPQFIPAHISNKSPEPSSLDDWLERGTHFQQDISPRDFKDEISPQAFLDQSTHRQNIQKLETVKVELAQRLSSTPLAAPIRFDPDEDDAMCSTRMADGLAFPTPSPIIGRRVSNATVVKDKPSLSLLSRARHDPVLQQYEPTVKDVRPLINKESDVKKSLFGGVSDSTEDLTASHAGPPHCNHHDNQHSALRTALETKVGVITSPKASHRGVPLLLKSDSVSPSGKRPHSHDRETASSRLAAASTESTRKKMKPDVAQHSRPNAPSTKSQFHKAGNPKTSKPLCRTSKVAPNKVPAPTNKTLGGNKAAGMKSSGGTTKTAEATGIKPVGVATKPAGIVTKAEPEAERGMTRTMMLRRQALGVDKKAEPKKVTNPKTKKAVPLKPKSVTTGTKEETNQTSNIIKRPVKGLAQSKLTLIRNKNAEIKSKPTSWNTIRESVKKGNLKSQDKKTNSVPSSTMEDVRIKSTTALGACNGTSELSAISVISEVVFQTPTYVRVARGPSTTPPIADVFPSGTFYTDISFSGTSNTDIETPGNYFGASKIVGCSVGSESTDKQDQRTIGDQVSTATSASLTISVRTTVSADPENRILESDQLKSSCPILLPEALNATNTASPGFPSNSESAQILCTCHKGNDDQQMFKTKQFNKCNLCSATGKISTTSGLKDIDSNLTIDILKTDGSTTNVQDEYRTSKITNDICRNLLTDNHALSRSSAQLSKDNTCTTFADSSRLELSTIRACLNKPTSTISPGRIPRPSVPNRSKTGLNHAQSILKLQGKAAIPRHPLPFAAKNVYYDERWMQKQERGFVLWLNFILTPPEEFSMEGYSRQKVDAGKLFMDSQRSDTVKLAPTKEVLSFRAYSARRNLNNLRRSMCCMYQKEATVISKLEREVELGRIRIRKDRKIHADLGLKQKLLDMLLCYNPLWLRVGLETVYGEQIMLVNNQDILTISRFIITRLLSNPDIAEQYAHPTVPHLYREGYDDVLAQFTLKKFLLLVLVLDRAKQQRLIKHDPCLFCKDAEFKTSRNLLLVFSRDCLAGEGDLTRHLSYFGYNVSHSQTALEEFDFAVSNLATDLRCGLRITRVIEMLTQNWLLSQELRAPAISRLQKIHNVEVGLKTLTDREVILRSDKGGNIDARDIVDGHREKTLSLLWLIIFNFQVETLINEAQLREEIDFVKKNLRYKKQLTRLLADMESCGTPDRRGSVDPDLYNRSKHLSLLLRWCQAVCAHYGMKIENFTVSFSDGRALCYLLHHYQPSLLSLEAVNADTTQTIEGEEKDGCDSDDSFSSNWTITGSTEDFERLLQNEKQNFKLLYEKVRELGGVPFMVKSSDMSNTIPDEKVVITFVTFLCSRLLDIRQEVRAARVIQAAWRQHRLHAQKQTRQVQIRAARTIQSAVRDFLNRCRIVKQTQAVILIQAQWRCLLAKKYVERMRLEKKYAKEIKAVTCIQKHVRSFLARRYEQHRILAAITLQATWRGRVTRNNLSHQQDAARTIQSHYRAWKQGRSLRKQLIVQQKSAVKLQSVVRGYLARRLIKKQRAVFVLQAFFRTCVLQRRFRVQKQKVTQIAAWYKMIRERKEFVAKKKATIIIQEKFRAILKARIQQQEYLNLKQAAVCIQRFYRAAVAARLQKRLSAASRIQAWFRGYQTRNEFLRIRKATVSIQCRYRALVVGREQMLMYHITRGATIIIQSWVRRYLVSQKMKRMHRAATVLQASYRCKIALEAFREKIDACLEIQRWFRSSMIVRAQQSNYLLTRIKVVKVQAVIRGFLSRKEYQNKKHAAVLIQTVFRRYQAQKSFTQKKAACAVIQNWFRESMLLRAEQSNYTLTRSKIIKIQSVVRGYLARSLYQRQRAAAVRIQSNWRSHSCQKKFMQLKKATCTIQQRYRAQVQARQQAMIFQKTKAAIVCIQRAYRAYQGRLVLEEMFAAIKMQSIWRGYKERTQFLQKREACIKIQSTWRGYTQYKSYEQKKLSCIKIQTAWRGYRERMDYQQKRTACIAIQAAWRGFKQRTSFSHQKAACIKIQSLVRGHQQWLKYQTIRGAVRVLQAKWRAVLQTRVQRIQYQIMTRSAVTIQSMIRSWIQRQKFRKLRNAVVCLQSAIRGHLTRQKVKAQHKAACVIQTRFRAHLQAKFTRMYYNTLRNSAIVIQSHYRRYQAQTLLAQHKAARTIQSLYRMYQARKSHVHLCKSTVIIQSVVRGYLSRKCLAQKQSAAVVIQRAFRAAQLSQNVRSEYLLKKHSANIIKAWYRGYKQQRRYSTMKQGFSKLQAVVRSRKQQKQFSRLKQATCVIQRRYRALMQGRARREIYRAQHKAIITIQSAYRGYKSRCHFKQIQSAIVLQKYWRRHNTRKSFLLKRQAAVVLQKHFRRRLAYMQYKKQKEAVFCIVKRWQATLLMKQHRKQYMVKVGAAMTIQAAYKSYHQRKLFCKLKHGFTKLQAVVRGRAERKKFHALVNAAGVIQKRFRALQAGRQTRNEYDSLMAASLILQTQWRMICARRRYKQIHQAAVTIQARFRSRHAQRQYGAVKKAADVLQTHFRALLIGRRLRKEFIVKQQSVILLQRTWRAALVTKQEKQHKAACRIQTAFRAYTIRRDFLGKRKAAIMIQSFVRGIMQRRQYHTLQSVVLVIQRLYRAKLATRLAQQTFHMQKRAVVTIQTMYRAHKARHSFLRFKSAAICVQTAYRAYKASQHFRQTKAAVILIQSCIRRYTAQCHYKRTINAILMIQHKWRATVQMKKAVIGYQSTRQAAIIIQSATRGWLQRKRNSVIELGITKLQALVRGRLQRVAYRRLVLATRVLQKQYRVYINRRSLQQEYERTLASTIKLQAQVRALQARKLYKKMKAAVVLQKHWRGLQVRNEKKRLLRSVVLVQSVIRGWIERRRHLVRVSETKAAVVIQKHWRGRQVRHQKMSMLSSIVLVQSAVRGWIERKRHLVRVSETKAAVVMQKHWRVRQALHQKKRMLNSIVLIQSAIKGWLERKRHLVRVSETKAAVVIQKHWRSRQVRHQKKRMLRSTVLVQSVVRGWIERRRHLVRVSRTKAALVIQKHWRGRQARHQKKQLLSSIVLMQSVIRGWMERKRHLVRVSETKAATTIQRMFRRHLSIKHEQEVVQKRAVHLEKYCLVTKRHLSVIHIQRAWRRRRVLIKATHQMAAVVTIQRWMKSRIQRLQYLRLLRNVRTLQRHARTYLERRHLAALRIQHCVRMWLTKQQQAKKEAAATSIQAQWRGYCVRRSTKDVKVKKARKRVQEATQKATEDQKLCNRTRSALSYLLTCKQLALVLDAVMSLDAATRLSSLCCEWMISEQAQHILFGLIKGCNRSVPHMEIIKYTVNTFLNLAKYEKTRAAVYDVDCSVEILVDLLSIYREKGGVIFTKTCTLLGLLCNNEHRRQEILSKWKIVDKILSIRALTARKHKMEKQRAVTKAKMAASRSLTNANILDTRHLRLRPDWCARRDSLREIEDPLQAIDFVMSTLELTPK